MTHKGVSSARQERRPVDPGVVSSLVDRFHDPGSSVSFRLPEGTVNVTLDRNGDWTIMVGLSAGFSGLSSAASSLERLGFFGATENDGISYLLWTSALEDEPGSRSKVEKTLFEALKTIQRNMPIQYIS